MNARLSNSIETKLNHLAALQSSADTACARIAPTWPLDQFIAVNPYWGWVDRPFAEVAAELERLSGAAMWTPRDQQLASWKAGHLRSEHLQAALAANPAAAGGMSVDELTRALHQAAGPSDRHRLHLITELVDAQRDLTHAVAWRDFVTHQISQHCAGHFDFHQAVWSAPKSGGLYASWLQHMKGDHSALLLMGGGDWHALVAALPEQPADLMAWAVNKLQVPPSAMTDYFTALLLSINGWASWCAYERWQVGLAGAEATTPCESTGAVFDRDALSNLLAVRLAWECLLLRDVPAHSYVAWRTSLENPAADGSPTLTDVRADTSADTSADTRANIKADTKTDAQVDALLQSAAEIAYQAPLCQGLLQAKRPAPAAAVAGTATATSAGASATSPKFQAVFCIDVRSEVFRRALEGTGQHMQTRGFAGFFGLPISYRPIGTALVRPQLPGLLSAAHEVTEVIEDASLGQVLARQRRTGLQLRARWQEFRTGASSGFSFVESCGLFYGGKLLSASLPSQAEQVPVEQTGLSGPLGRSLRPQWSSPQTRTAAELTAQCDLAATVLGAMGWDSAMAASHLVLLAGHGSQTTNNPHAAGLDCGACGGQTGEVNARVLVALLNDTQVREGLRNKGMDVAARTQFVAGLHNTTTDEMVLYDLELLPESHRTDVAELKRDLARAGDAARAERAPALGLAVEEKASISKPAQLLRTLKARANHWAEVRPEWALANNAAFIVAPRWRSQHLNLAGRSFLHDYDWQADTELKLLELIMTAPMVVTNWINLQYHASSVDPQRYGSGNKVLHNVVGGRLGVFEGNGGDLRIGLPWQSVHDGDRLMHTPLRLSVFIEAPQANLQAMINKHAVVRQLVENQWLHLFQIDPTQPQISQFTRGEWTACGSLA